MVSFAKNKKAQPNKPGLTEAALENNLDAARTLLAAGADVHEKSIGYSSPLHAAANAGHLEMVELLLEHGARPGRVGDEMYSPLDGALQKGHVQIARKLLDKGAKVKVEPNALEYAVLGPGGVESLKLLIEYGLKIDPKSDQAASALRKAAFKGKYSCAKFLVEAGVDPKKHPLYEVDLFGEKLAKPDLPADHAKRNGFKVLAAYLKGEKIDEAAALAAEKKGPKKQ